MKGIRFGKIFLLVAAVIGILDTLIMRSRSGSMDLGILLPGVGGIIIILGLIFVKTKVYRINPMLYNKLGKFTLVMFTLWMISFITVTVLLISSAISEKDKAADCVIVLGAGLKGETPTLVLAKRLDNTLQYAAENPGVSIIVSGGQGIGETITEAEAMKRYLVRRGIPEKFIIKEEKATSTYENMLYSKKVYEEQFGYPPEKVMIITNDFHMFRSKILAERVGLKAYGMSSNTPWYIYPNVFLREYFALVKSLVLDR